MRPVFINLTEKQVEYLTAIKEEHGIAWSSYIRHLLRRDMMSGSDSTPIVRKNKLIMSSLITTTKTIRTESTAQWIALKKEIAPILAKRRVVADKYCVTRPSQS